MQLDKLLNFLSAKIDSRMKDFSFIDLNFMEYDDALAFQKNLVRKKANGEHDDYIIFVEHFPVITLGNKGSELNLLVDRDKLTKNGVSISRTDRGGDITYHGPGQLVCYPIIDLKTYRTDVRWYIGKLEEIIINICLAFHIQASTRPGMRGVWVEEEKIASIGVRITKWITYHGFALNANTNLSHFDLIVPCGLEGVKMTSIQKITGSSVGMLALKEITKNSFSFF
ncbi:MAG: lipoyl(octanoyl) transferase [Omnitrophica WOR_2 bacterium RBG_13_44_8]|nr:MAG: lipoyl(octanoyl) transferase [Omnitrophica WOR_2 bacterium RBG_13_44_8]